MFKWRGLLGIAFIVLKLVGILTAGWFWVLMPLWMIPIVWVVLVIIAAIFVGWLDKKDPMWRFRK